MTSAINRFLHSCAAHSPTQWYFYPTELFSREPRLASTKHVDFYNAYDSKH